MTSLETARSALQPSFEVEARGTTLIARRRRILPSRGIFRLLIPHVVLHVKPELSVRPDALAWLMLFFCLGGVVVELTMPRAQYPREYPPWFIFTLAACYVGALGFEWRQTRLAAKRALG